MGTASTAYNLLAARIAGLKTTLDSLSDEEMFALVALEIGEPPLVIKGGGKTPPVPGTSRAWLQQFAEICTVAGRKFNYAYQLGESIEKYRYWYVSQTRDARTTESHLQRDDGIGDGLGSGDREEDGLDRAAQCDRGHPLEV